MKQATANIERSTLFPSFQHLELSFTDDYFLNIKPGQSLLVRVNNSLTPYLLQQWWPVMVNRDRRIIVERPLNERYDVPSTVSVLGVVGQPFRFRGAGMLRNVLLVAFDTNPTPLLMTIPWLLGNKISVTLVLLGSAMEFDTKHLPAEVEIELGDPVARGGEREPGVVFEQDENEFIWRNQVMTLGWADQVFVTVGGYNEAERFNKVLDRFRQLRQDIPRNYLFGVFQPMLPCGTGACHACMLRTSQGNGTTLVCTDGPAFDLTQIILS
jgi:hypothetical protein